jgi:replicative DNA helicase
MTAHSNIKAQHANPKLERILLGGLILNNNLYWQIEHSIRTDAFTAPIHRAIFEQVADMIVAGQAVKLSLLCSRLPEEGEDENGRAQSMRSYISICIDQAGDVNAADCADDIAEMASKRRLLRLSEQITKAVQKGDKRSDEIATELETEALDIVGVSMPNRPKRLSEIVSKVVKQSRMAQEKGTMPGMTTGLATLDELVGLIFPTDLIGILAAQSDGKSALSQQIGMHIAKTKPVLMIQMEMSSDEVAVREVAAASGVSSYAIREGSVNAFDFEDKVSPTEETLSHPDFYVQDAKKMTVRQIKGVALSLHRKRKLGLLIIDQLDKIKSDGWTKDKFERAEEVLTDLKDLAKDLQVPILILAQRSRGGQRSDNEVPDINDSAMGPALEHNCDTLIGLWRRESFLQKQRPNSSNAIATAEWESKLEDARSHGEVIILKRRSGKRYVRRALKWVGSITRFYDL